MKEAKSLAIEWYLAGERKDALWIFAQFKEHEKEMAELNTQRLMLEKAKKAVTEGKIDVLDGKDETEQKTSNYDKQKTLMTASEFYAELIAGLDELEAQLQD
jgi:hypothetical protein